MAVARQLFPAEEVVAAWADLAAVRSCFFGVPADAWTAFATELGDADLASTALLAAVDTEE
eukprot:2609245-Lingulodinium_polyedra.AAC.1